jgi:hypothetical protein
MIKTRLEKHAWVIACVSLFVALSSGAYALSVVPKNSVTSKSIKNGAVRGKDVRDNSLTGADVDESTLDRAGLPQGPQGPAGPTGASGASIFDAPAIPSGKTVRGYVGDDSHAAAPGEDADAGAALPLPAPVPITSAMVDIDGTADEVGDRCTGSAATPTAPPGVICIYTAASGNVAAGSLSAVALANTSFGFVVNVNAEAAGDFFYHGIWAYTAP